MIDGWEMTADLSQIGITDAMECILKLRALVMEERAVEVEVAKAFKAEMKRARSLHPKANFLALSEEVGEVAKAMLENDLTHAREEALQVAVVAIRMYQEGMR